MTHIYCQIVFQSSHVFSSKEEDTFAEEIEKHMIAEFSVLELYLITNGHVFGSLMFHLLQMFGVCGYVRKLKVILEGSMVILCSNYITYNDIVCSNSHIIFGCR